jgi:hypothetical protein
MVQHRTHARSLRIENRAFQHGLQRFLRANMLGFGWITAPADGSVLENAVSIPTNTWYGYPA